MSSVETQEDIQDQEREEKIAPRKDKDSQYRQKNGMMRGETVVADPDRES